MNHAISLRWKLFQRDVKKNSTKKHHWYEFEDFMRLPNDIRICKTKPEKMKICWILVKIIFFVHYQTEWLDMGKKENEIVEKMSALRENDI